MYDAIRVLNVAPGTPACIDAGVMICFGSPADPMESICRGFPDLEP